MSSHPIQIKDAIHNARLKMCDEFHQSWIYWPLRYFSSLGAFFALSNNSDNQAFIQCYNDSSWFFQWWFKRYLTQPTLQQFEDVITTYHQYVKEDASNLSFFDSLPTHFLKALGPKISKDILQSIQPRDFEIIDKARLTLTEDELKKLIEHRNEHPHIYYCYKNILPILDHYKIPLSFSQLLDKNLKQIENMRSNFIYLGKNMMHFTDKIDWLCELDYQEVYYLINQESFLSCTRQDLKMYQSLQLMPENFNELCNYRTHYQDLESIIKACETANIKISYPNLLKIPSDMMKQISNIIQILANAQSLNEEKFQQILRNKHQHQKLFNIVQSLSKSQSLSMTTFQIAWDFEDNALDCISTLRAELSLAQVDDIFLGLNFSSYYTSNLIQLLTTHKITFNLKYLSEVGDKKNFMDILILISSPKSNLTIESINELISDISLEQISNLYSREIIRHLAH